MSLDISLILDGKVIFDTNITHNLGIMASESGIYNACWCPNKINCYEAKDVIPILESGLKELKDCPEKFKKFNSSNGWGTYDAFIPWIENYLDTCKKYPTALIHTFK